MYYTFQAWYFSLLDIYDEKYNDNEKVMQQHMRLKLLGKTGLSVSELCLGTMTFGDEWGALLRGAPKEESKKMFDAFMDTGGNF
jgi:hypothetical protein